MGRNAQRRRAEKAKRKAMAPATLRPHGSTRTFQHLKAKMLEVTTLQQFEEIVAQAHTDHRGTTRKLLARMVRPNLPCCGAAILAKKIGAVEGEYQHTRLCPTRNRVEVAE